MPRKPSSVFVILESPSPTGQGPLQAYREPLDGTSYEEIVAANYARHPIGSRLYFVEDTKVDAKDVNVRLDDVDDPRLPDEEDPLGRPV